MTGQHAHARERAASVAQYILMGGFAAAAAGISGQGLTGFARANMELTGASPYLLFFALDGAAGVCAVLLVRRAARAESSLAPRLAFWGLVAASSTFNWTHAPHRPAALEAFGLMPVVAALLLEFCLRELRRRTLAGRVGRTLSAWRWFHPAERIRVQLRMAADEQLPAEAATRHVRADHATRRLYQLKTTLDAHDQSHAHGAMAARRVRKAEHRAHRALTRAGFADPATATAILRQVQVLTMTTALARLDYHTPDAAQAAIVSLITSPSAAKPRPGTAARTAHPTAGEGTADTNAAQQRTPASQVNGHPANNGPHLVHALGARDAQLAAAAIGIVAAAARGGGRLSQAGLAGRLRREGREMWLPDWRVTGATPASPASAWGSGNRDRWPAIPGGRSPGSTHRHRCQDR